MRPLASIPSLRKSLREARRSLGPKARHQNEIRIAEALARYPLIQRSGTVALYLPNDGEVDLTLLLRHLLRRGKRVCLPVLCPGSDRRLWFVPFAPGDALYFNRFGIPEPDRRRSPLKLRAIDAILMPLVGFDASMHRLGMGGGYYDRTLVPLKRSRWHRPRLIGVAHECQRVGSLEVRPWDIPMDLVVTELGPFCLQRGGCEAPTRQ